MKSKVDWSTNIGNKNTMARKLLSNLSLSVREEQFQIFWKLIKPTQDSKIIDVGITPVEDLIDSNFFEKRYPYPENLTAVSVEDCNGLRKKYPKITIKKIKPFARLPFKNNNFDIAVSWATIEHVGKRKDQKLFLSEISRIAKKVFITTPNRNLLYEPHSGLLFVHWLNHKYFKNICNKVGKSFWGDIYNLNPLSKRDINKILPNRKFETRIYKMFKVFSSHILAIKRGE